jgi:hypothetical protein
MVGGERWFTRKNDTAPEKGPFDGAALLRALDEGHLSKKTLVRRDGETAWLPVGEHAALRKAPANPVASSPAEAPSETREVQLTALGGGERCPICGGPFAAKHKKSFLGFPTRRCVMCEHAEPLPLTPTYRFIYWLVATWVGFWLLVIGYRVMAIVGQGATPHLDGSLIQSVSFGFLSAYALLRDRDLRRQLSSSAST